MAPPRGPVMKGNAKAYRSHFVAASGEFVGTTLFLFFAFAWHMTVASKQAGTDAAMQAGNAAQTVMFVSMAYAFPLLVNVWVFYRISGGIFNPAVALGLCTVGVIPWQRAVLLVPAEILGGITAAGLVSAMFPGDISSVCTGLSPETSVARGVFIEMFLTSMLVLTIFMLAVEKSRTTFMAPVGIGLALFIAELAGVAYTGGSLNPARSLGPAVVAGKFPSYHWIYWLGPCMGSLVSSGYFYFVKYMWYEQANPGQDGDGTTVPASVDETFVDEASVDESSVVASSSKQRVSVQTYDV